MVEVEFLGHNTDVLFGGGKILVDIHTETPTPSPPDFATSEQIMPIVVDLPAPLGPNRAKKSPCSTSRLMPLRPQSRRS